MVSGVEVLATIKHGLLVVEDLLRVCLHHRLHYFSVKKAWKVPAVVSLKVDDGVSSSSSSSSSSSGSSGNFEIIG